MPVDNPQLIVPRLQAHPQQHGFVPSYDVEGLVGTGIEERAIFERASYGAADFHDGSTSRTPAETARGAQDTYECPNERTSLNNGIAGEGFVADHPSWRQPSPGWMYLFVVGVALSLGLTAPPKSELFVNLACLAHPPDQSENAAIKQMYVSQDVGDYMQTSIAKGWQSNSRYLKSISASTEQAIASCNPVTQNKPCSFAEEWITRIQRNGDQPRLSRPEYHINLKMESGDKKNAPQKFQPIGPSPRPRSFWDSGSEDTNFVTDEAALSGAVQDISWSSRAINPQLCKRDPKVLAAAARLTMILTLVVGILSALTTGFWGQTSDHLGRAKVMAIVEFGLLLKELCFVLVASFPHLAPGGYYSLLIVSIIEGLLGGLSTITATVNAYLSDVTPDGSRVTVFSRVTGIMMGGFAAGPVLGSLLIQVSGNIMTPFYVNLLIHSVYTILIVLFLPESLSSQARLILSKKALLAKQAAERAETIGREWGDEVPEVPNSEPNPTLNEANLSLSGWFSSNSTHLRGCKHIIGTLRRLLKHTFSFLDPLSIFLPKVVKNPWSRRKTRDWRMTLVAMTLFLIHSVFGIMQTKTQYTFYAFGWTSAQLGPYMSAMAFLRSFVLICLVPLATRVVKACILRSKSTIDKSDIGSSAQNFNESAAGGSPSSFDQQSALLDLWSIRVCLMLELVPWILLVFGPPQWGFIVLSALVTFGSPSMPAANSLALSLLPDSSQSGRLFGALSVIDALSTTLVSPILFGTIFAATVGTYAPTIFAVAAACVALAFGFMLIFQLKTTAEEGGVE
ncbi:hypothetical protein L204_104818 [Cryptococcus depauperatus]|nr:hypothetical protein L204_05327 [Cryptococcus depauperatus CBS 7855]